MVNFLKAAKLKKDSSLKKFRKEREYENREN
jgi:hypothetical protein